MLFTPVYGQPDGGVCPVGYTIGFFNGVWNTEAQAAEALQHIRVDLGIGYTHNNQRVRYEVFYNQTGGLADVAEVAEQRARELDGALENHWEIFWEALGSSSDESSFLLNLTTSIRRVSPELENLVAALATDYLTKTSALFLDLLTTDPPTEADIATHRARIRALAPEEKLLFIAHSQGNLFVNLAYKAALEVTEASRVKVVHVAPASVNLSGSYVLADLDSVINPLRLQGLLTVPRNNADIPLSHLATDPSGHKFIETYLNKKLTTYTEVKKFVDDAMSALAADTRDCIAIVSAFCFVEPEPSPRFTISMRGTANSQTVGALIIPHVSTTSRSPNGTQMSFCDEWPGNIRYEDLTYCQRQFGDPSATVWHSAFFVPSVPPLYLPPIAAFSSLISSPYEGHDLVPPVFVPLTCPGSYPPP